MTTKIRGVALVPGISANNRFYSADLIRAAVEDAQPRVRAGRMLMKSHHGAADTLGYVGKITALKVAEDGSAQFEAELADTSTARDVSALIRSRHVDGVSIAGEWTGKTKLVNVGGRAAETSSGLRLHSIDFTGTPGVDAARVVAESAARNTRLIFETAPVEPVTPELTASAYAGLSEEEFEQASAAHWARTFAAMDDRRAEPGSPFWRGLPGITADSPS